MLVELARFEVQKRLRLVSTYVYFAVFVTGGFLLALAGGGAFAHVTVGAGSEKVLANAPARILLMITLVTGLGGAVSASLFGQAGFQDFESRCDFLFFTSPISKGTFLTGRFVGAFAVTLLVVSGVGWGLALGAVCPFWVNPALFGPTPPGTYLWPYLVMVLPNLFFTGGLFFTLGALGRHRMPVSIGAVFVTMGYLVANNLLGDVENKTLAAVVDPLGLATLQVSMRYWTTIEQNTRLLPLSRLVLVNRALWCLVGLGALAYGFGRFRFVHHGTPERPTAAPPAPAVRAPAPRVDSLSPPSFATAFRHFAGSSFAETIKHPRFVVLAVTGSAFTLFALWQSGKIYGTRIWPLTARTAEFASAGFGLIMLAITAFYVGEVAWRERDLHFDGIVDALPVPDAAIYLGKLVSLCTVPLVLLAVVMACGMVFQSEQGFHRYQPGLYLEWLYGIQAPYFLGMVILALTVQAVLLDRDVAMFAFVGLLIVQAFQDQLGFERQLFQYARHGGVVLSDMDGLHHFVQPVVWYGVYWGCAYVLLAVVGYLFWTRGTEESVAGRLKLARARFTAVPRGLAAVSLLGFVATGAFIYYSTSILNHYRSRHDVEAAVATYEKKYKRFEGNPEPRIAKETLRLDLYPEDETLDAKGTYELVNRSLEPVRTVHVTLQDYQPFRTLSVGPVAAPTASDVELGWYTFDLPEPLPPGGTLPLVFDVRYHDPALKERGSRKDLSVNGTFFNTQFLPHIGYDRAGELEEDNQRAKYDLPARERYPDLDDVQGRQTNLLAADADWVSFDATIATDADQIAIAPGTLEREWNEGGRHLFHYRTQSPILGFYTLLSARYAVRRDRWNGVPLEIFYQPGHEFDLDEMMAGLKAALAYNSEAFGPYPFADARIAEFPRFDGDFAQAYAGTIPFSEGLGFIARVDPSRKDDIDYPLYVTAHEASHQWWGHQVVGGRVQGVTFLDETLAQYSALMVMKQRFGDAQMRRFLRYELDGYLSGRAQERKKEVPLERVEDQSYIRYKKGSLVMYALQDAIGEANVNRALKAFLERNRFKGPPYPNARELVDDLRRVTPEESKPLIHDLFEAITLYDLRALDATATKRPDGQFDVALVVSVKKLEAAENGHENELAFDQRVDVGGLDAAGEPVVLEKQRLKSGTSTVHFVAARPPAKAGIDPLNKLIDREPDDNVVAVKGP